MYNSIERTKWTKRNIVKSFLSTLWYRGVKYKFNTYKTKTL